jgi:hypothetical protein
MIIFLPTATIRVDPERIPWQALGFGSRIEQEPFYFHCGLSKKESFQMTETDDEALKAEIDEIMSKVDTIMNKVAQIIPEDTKGTDGQELPDRAP